MKQKVCDVLYYILLIGIPLFTLTYAWYNGSPWDEGYKWHQNCRYEYIAEDHSRNDSNSCEYTRDGVPKCDNKEVLAFIEMCRGE